MNRILFSTLLLIMGATALILVAPTQANHPYPSEIAPLSAPFEFTGSTTK